MLQKIFLILGCMILGLGPIFSSMPGAVEQMFVTDQESQDSPVYYVVAQNNGGLSRGGKYLLRVKDVVSEVEREGSGEYVELVVIQPFWRTWWFKTMTLFVALALFVALYNLIYRIPTLNKERNKNEILNDRFEDYGLSPREREVVRLLLQGKSNRTIENELFISSHTVKNHIYNIYQKLGVKRRTQIFNLLQSM